MAKKVYENFECPQCHSVTYVIQGVCAGITCTKCQVECEKK